MRKQANSFLRPLWLALGLLSVAIGVIGIFLPILPTTPLMILAAFFFARSSKRLENKLLEHPIFGPIILDWRKNGAIAPRIKVIAVGLMGVTIISAVLIGVSFKVVIIQAGCIALVSLYIVTRPNH